MPNLHKIAFLLLVVGGINWLLEAFGFGIGKFLPEPISMIVYVLVGLAAIYELASHKTNCAVCKGPASMPEDPHEYEHPGHE